MPDDEFDAQAAAIATEVQANVRAGRMAADERIAAACRGSANPAALAWLAEGLALHRGATVIDLGSGLGGPSSWMAARYGCVVVAMEPAVRAAMASATLFRLPVVNGSSDNVPFRSDAFDASLLLGVLSVVDEPVVVLREARRVGRRLGVLDYCSTFAAAVHVGGSHFATPGALAHAIEAAGWCVVQTSPMPVLPPRSWADAAAKIAVEPSGDENDVVAAIEAGAITPHMFIGSR